MPQIDHIGIAVREAKAVCDLFQKLFQAEPYKVEDVAGQQVRTHFIDAGGTKIELLEALSDKSPITHFLEKRGEGIHHLAFEVPNINLAWRMVQQQGFQPLGDGPTPGADGKTIFFLHPKQTHGMLIEFCQSSRKEIETRWIALPDGQLATYILGKPDAQPLVILHGAAGCTAMETELLVRRLANHYRVVALDFVGHGQSDAFDDQPFTPDLFTDHVLAVFDHYEVEKARLFGFSLGGFIALSFAHRFPARIEKLAVHATNLFWDPPLIEKMIERVDVDSIQRDTPELAAYLSKMHGANKWVSLFERTRTYTQRIGDFKAAYEKATQVTVDTLVTAVHDDDLFSIDSPVKLHKAIPNSKLAIIPGRRHAFQNVDLSLYVPILERYFAT